jgi:uncharacterized repeat protein (TIGR01451 family)
VVDVSRVSLGATLVLLLAALSSLAQSQRVGSETLGLQTPSLSLQKLLPPSVPLGKPLVYEIIVRNTGPTPVCRVRLEDELPDSAKFLRADPPPGRSGAALIWDLGVLESGAERRVRVEIQPGREGELQTWTTVTSSASCAQRTHVEAPMLSLTLTGPDHAAMGATVNFTVTAGNAGKETVSGASIRVRVPVGLRHPEGELIEASLGTLDPGATRTFVLPLTVAGPGTHIVEGELRVGGGVRLSSRTSLTTTGTAPEPGLNVKMTGPARTTPGAEFEYQLQASNPGAAPTTGVVLTETLPDNLEYVAASSGGGYEPRERSVSWRLDAIPPGTTRAVWLRLRARTPGQVVTRAQARADGGLVARLEARLDVGGMARLRLEVADLRDPVRVGSDTTYEIRLLNSGSADATSVRVVGLLPSGLVAQDTAGPTLGNIQAGEVRFDPLKVLAPGAQAVYHVKARGRQVGDWRFHVEVLADGLAKPLAAEQGTRVASE